MALKALKGINALLPKREEVTVKIEHIPATYKIPVEVVDEVESLRRHYRKMPFDKLANMREDFAIGPDEILYRLGQDPEREMKLKAMTDVLFEMMD